MTPNSLKYLTTVLAAILLIAGGCAKKNKPDVDQGVNAEKTYQDKDLNFDASGSDSGRFEGLYSIHFDYDKSSLSPENRVLLVKDAEWLKNHSNKGLQIEGHCDRHGSIEYNLGLGQRRADAVLHYLLNLGIKKSRLSTVSYGKEKLFDTAETDEADAKNRRANFKPVEITKVRKS